MSEHDKREATALEALAAMAFFAERERPTEYARIHQDIIRAHIEAQAAEIADLRKGIMRRDDAVVVPLALWEEMDRVGLQWKAKAEAAEANARRYLHVITRGELPTKTVSGYHYAGGEFHATPEAAIDDAMRGGAE